MPTTLSQIISTLASMLHSRLDLMSVEIEEEVLRFSSYFIYTITALFCGGIAVSFMLLLILVLFWEEHRITVLLSFIALFSTMSVLIFLWLRKQLLNKPPLLQQSMTEFKKDIALLRIEESESDQQNGQGLS